MGEGMAQAGTLLVRYNLDEHEKYDILAFQIESARFPGPAQPGDRHPARAERELVQERSTLHRVDDAPARRFGVGQRRRRLAAVPDRRRAVGPVRIDDVGHERIVAADRAPRRSGTCRRA